MSGRAEGPTPSNFPDFLRFDAFSGMIMRICAPRRLLSSVLAAGFVFLLRCPVGAETDEFRRVQLCGERMYGTSIQFRFSYSICLIEKVTLISQSTASESKQSI